MIREGYVLSAWRNRSILLLSSQMTSSSTRNRSGMDHIYIYVIWLSEDNKPHFYPHDMPNKTFPAAVSFHKSENKSYKSNSSESFAEQIANAVEVQEIDTNLYMSKELWLPPGARGVFGGQVIGGDKRRCCLVLMTKIYPCRLLLRHCELLSTQFQTISVSTWVFMHLFVERLGDIRSTDVFCTVPSQLLYSSRKCRISCNISSGETARWSIIQYTRCYCFATWESHICQQLQLC